MIPSMKHILLLLPLLLTVGITESYASNDNGHGLWFEDSDVFSSLKANADETANSATDNVDPARSKLSEVHEDKVSSVGSDPLNSEHVIKENENPPDMNSNKFLHNTNLPFNIHENNRHSTNKPLRKNNLSPSFELSDDLTKNFNNVPSNKFLKRILISPTPDDENDPVNVDEVPEIRLDSWRPLWQNQELSSLDIKPTVRFPSIVLPNSVIESSLHARPDALEYYSVLKEPVTAYYFDLSSVLPTHQVGPLYDPSALESVSTPSSSFIHHAAEFESINSAYAFQNPDFIQPTIDDNIYFPFNKEIANIEPTPTLPEEYDHDEENNATIHDIIPLQDNKTSTLPPVDLTSITSLYNKTTEDLQNSTPAYTLGNSTDFQFTQNEPVLLKNSTNFSDIVTVSSTLSSEHPLELQNSTDLENIFTPLFTEIRATSQSTPSADLINTLSITSTEAAHNLIPAHTAHTQFINENNHTFIKNDVHITEKNIVNTPEYKNVSEKPATIYPILNEINNTLYSNIDIRDANNTSFEETVMGLPSLFNNNPPFKDSFDNSTVKFTDNELPRNTSINVLHLDEEGKNVQYTDDELSYSNISNTDVNIEDFDDHTGIVFYPDVLKEDGDDMPTIPISNSSFNLNISTTQPPVVEQINISTSATTTSTEKTTPSTTTSTTTTTTSTTTTTTTTTTTPTTTTTTSTTTTPENVPENLEYIFPLNGKKDSILNETDFVPGDNIHSHDHDDEHPITVVVSSNQGDEPELNLVEMHKNGTNVTHPSPYIKAAVSYDLLEFCHHQKRIEALLEEWINTHLSNASGGNAFDIEIFHQPDCENLYIHHDTADDLDNKTILYFYVKQNGEISPNSTLMYPRNPTNLEISQELDYLKEKILHLELMNASSSEDRLFEEAAVGTSIVVIVVVTTLLVLVLIGAVLAFFVIKRRRAAETMPGRRCTPATTDAYSLDSVSVFYHSLRRKSKKRASNKSLKSYLNQGFDDPNLPSRPLNFAKLTHFISDNEAIYDEFSNIPSVVPKYDEMPKGVEEKNRYANVIPVPETRILLDGNKTTPSTQYINANSIHGPKGELRYYIATQAPLDNTVADFWQMIWEQESKVIVMLTDFVEKGIDKCADYLPPSETLDCHRVYGEFQITLKSRDMREKYVVSLLQIKNLENNLVREIAHMWYTGWPQTGVPIEEKLFISFIFDVRTTRKQLRAKGPIIVHCSPGTGRTGTYIACDLCMRQFDEQKVIDIPKTVFRIRRERAGAVQTKEQYAFIYRVVNLYAAKLTTGNLDSF